LKFEVEFHQTEQPIANISWWSPRLCYNYINISRQNVKIPVKKLKWYLYVVKKILCYSI